MMTFKQFLQEANRFRKDGILYSGPTLPFAQECQQFAPQLKQLVSDLRLEKRFQDAHIHASLYADNGGYRLLELKLPIPDGLDDGEAEFFIKLALKAVTNRLRQPAEIMVRDKHRAFYHDAAEFTKSIAKRRDPQTAGDALVLEIKVKINEDGSMTA